MAIPPPTEETMAKIIAIQPPTPDRMRADLRAARDEITELLKNERAPTPTEIAAVRRKLTPIVDHSAELPTFADRVKKLSRYGKRLPTGIPTLDLATRGGLPVGKRLILIGAPGVSKTGLGLNIARTMIYAGCHVGIHAADEDLDSLLVRLGQTEGLCREDLEEGNVWSLGKLTEYLCERYPRLLAVDQEEDGWTLDDTVEELIRRRDEEREGQLVLFVDSIQTATIRGAASFRSKREEIDAVVKRLKTYSARGILVIATSEMNRRGYASKVATENVEDIASAAESRSIEFAAHTMITLKSVKDHEDLVDARVPKNRLGRGKPKFRLQINFDRATIVEAEPEEEVSLENEQAKDESRKAKRVRDLSDQIFEALLKQRAHVTSLDQFRALVKGNSDDKRLAVALLKNEGRIAWEKTEGKKGRWRPVTAGSEQVKTGVSEGVSTHAHPMTTHVPTQGTPTALVDVPTQPTQPPLRSKGGGMGGLDATESQPDSAHAHPSEAMPTQNGACLPNAYPTDGEGER